MIVQAIDFANLLLGALVAGALFGAWLFLRPTGLDARTYVTVQQQAIRTMNTAMPALGAATIFLTLAAAVAARGDAARVWLLAGAAVCLTASGGITRFVNQPINATVMTWSADGPAANWTALRDAWWRWHVVRVASGLAGMALLIAARLKRG